MKTNIKQKRIVKLRKKLNEFQVKNDDNNDDPIKQSILHDNSNPFVSENEYLHMEQINANDNNINETNNIDYNLNEEEIAQIKNNYYCVATIH